MIYILITILFFLLSPAAAAVELTAPTVPDSGAEFMPRDTSSFGDGIMEIMGKAMESLRPDM